MTKREVVDRISVLDAEIEAREEERAMLRELLAGWPDGQDTLHAIDSEPPDTLPGTPTARSSQRMRAVTLPPRDDDEE
jgi:hypothetical protein